MSGQPQQSDEYDSPWKQVIERFFPQFMAFFFAEIHKEIDWSKDYQFLDKELQKIVRDAGKGKRFADKLVKVWRLDGSEAWVLIHIEVQGQREAAFEARMYEYNHRLADTYNQFVVSLAVLADTSPRWRPRKYQAGLWGCKITFEFPTVKLLDWRDRKDWLEQQENVFAIVVLAHLETQATRRNPEGRFDAKWRLTRRLFDKGYSREEIIALYHFIDWIMALPEVLQHRFDDTVEAYEKERRMEYVTHIERRAVRRQLMRVLGKRFAHIPEDMDDRLASMSAPQLERLFDAALDADSLETFVKGLPAPKGS